MLPFWTNFLIRTYAWILLLNNAGWVNQWLQALGLTDEPISMLYTPQAIVVGLLYMYLPLMVLPLYASLQQLDPSLREAATNLGASPWRAFRTVTLPLSLPGALTGCIFVFVPAGVLAALLYNAGQPSLFALFALVMLVFVLSFNSIGVAATAAERRGPMAKLFESSRALHGARRIDELGERILTEARTLFRFDEFYFVLVEAEPDPPR